MLGYCNEGDKLAVIYEYMANGNLKQHISGSENLFLFFCSLSLLHCIHTLKVALYILLEVTPIIRFGF